MKTLVLIAMAALLSGCVSRPADPMAWKSSSLHRHLETRSEWGAIQGGVSARLREAERGIVLVIRNDGRDDFVIDPSFEEGYNVEIEAYDEAQTALTGITGPTFANRMASQPVRLRPGKEFTSAPIYGFDGKYAAPVGTRWLVAVWYRNTLGSPLRGPVVTGPLAVRQGG